MGFFESMAKSALRQGARNLARTASDEDIERMSQRWSEHGDDSVFRDGAKILERERRKREKERSRNW